MHTKNSSKRRKIEYRRMLISQLYHKGYREQYEIAEQLEKQHQIKVDRSTVSRDLKVLEKRWIEATQRDLDAAKGEMVAEIMNLRSEYWTAWQRSCEDAESSTLKTKGKVQKRQDSDSRFVAEQPAEVAKTSKGQAGDPRFLAGVQWCIERRCKILGLDAPEKQEMTGETVLKVVYEFDSEAEDAA